MDLKEVAYDVVRNVCAKQCPAFETCRKNLNRSTKQCGWFEKEFDIIVGDIKAKEREEKEGR